MSSYFQPAAQLHEKRCEFDLCEFGSPARGAGARWRPPACERTLSFPKGGGAVRSPAEHPKNVSLPDARPKVGDDLLELVIVERLGDLERADQEDRRAFESEGVRLGEISLEKSADVRVVDL